MLIIAKLLLTLFQTRFCSEKNAIDFVTTTNYSAITALFVSFISDQFSQKLISLFTKMKNLLLETLASGKVLFWLVCLVLHCECSGDEIMYFEAP